MNGEYGILAPFYDRLNGGVDYDSWADFVEQTFQKYGIGKGDLVLDLACGTGSMTYRLLERGYDVIGVDLSPEMLTVARETCEKRGFLPLLLCQDMCELDLYGTVDGAICCLDSVNYLTGDGELAELFRRLHNFIRPGGIFLFDVNTERKFREVYGSNCYTYDTPQTYCVWQNDYHPDTRLCDFDLIFFIKEGDLFRRMEEHQQERCYPKEEIAAVLRAQGFEILGIFSDFAGTPAGDSDLRHYYLVRRAVKI